MMLASRAVLVTGDGQLLPNPNRCTAESISGLDGLDTSAVFAGDAPEAVARYYGVGGGGGGWRWRAVDCVGGS